MLYYSVIYPRILYGIELYANTYLTYLHDLMILNNRLLRILQHKSLITNVQHLYIAFNTLPVNKLFQFQMLVHAHAIYFQLPSLPEIFQLSHKRNSEIHSYNTRHSQDFHRLSVTSIYGKKISSNLCMRLWNLLPADIKGQRSVKLFKNQLKFFLFSHEI